MPHTPALTALLAALAAPAALAEPVTLILDHQLNWQTTPEGVAFAALEGDRFSTAYRAMVRLPAGTVSPPHVKSANMFGVMIAGEMLHYAASVARESAVPVGPGAFYKIPAGLAHISACVSETPCVTYLYQDGAFDFLPVSQ